MISFYPGPSRVYGDVPRFVAKAYKNGYLSCNHRSEAFMQLYEDTEKTLQEKLDLPENYTLLFTSSATEGWEITAQSLIKKDSLHIYNGAFGKKWQQYTSLLIPEAKALPFDTTALPSIVNNINTPELIALTHNETSNGFQLPDSFLKEIRAQFPKSLVAIDATSSMAGVALPWEIADVWLASSQKCFGLPAGLGLYILSPKAVAKANALHADSHYNSLPFMLENAKKHQTHYTPNVLNIYLLNQLQQSTPGISAVHAKLKKRKMGWLKFFEQFTTIHPYIQNKAFSSDTVLVFSMDDAAALTALKKAAYDAGFMLGNGYGELKANTFRIANFPAILEKEIHQLKSFFRKYFSS